MDASELAQHEQQLAMVEEALSVDPDRQDLIELKTELENIIKLLREYMVTEQPTASSSKAPAPAPTPTPTPEAKSGKPELPTFHVGQNVLARFSDGLFYPARVTRTHGTQYTVLFDGYGDKYMAKAEDLRPPQAATSNAASPSPAPASSNTPVVGDIVRPSKQKEEDAEAERRKKRSEKKRERFENKKIEAEQKQSSWQKFALKGTKKGYSIAGAKGKSMFRTPDDPTAKVGVVGAGRGMKSNSQRSKHTQNTLG